jgi:hypothetical protein
VFLKTRTLPAHAKWAQEEEMRKFAKMLFIEMLIYVTMICVSLFFVRLMRSEFLVGILIASVLEELFRRLSIKFHGGVIYTSLLAISEAVGGLVFILEGSYFLGAIIIMSRVFHFYLLDINRKNLLKAVLMHVAFNAIVITCNLF